jgi:hypothetical protein
MNYLDIPQSVEGLRQKVLSALVHRAAAASERIITISVDANAIDSGTPANAYIVAKIRTGDGSSWNDLWQGLADGGTTGVKNYGQIKGSFTIVHDVDDGFVGLPNTRHYQVQLYATGATSRQYFYCTIVVQSVKK